MFQLQQNSIFSNVDGPNKGTFTELATPHLVWINGRPNLLITGQKYVFERGLTFTDVEYYTFINGSFQFVTNNASPIANLPKNSYAVHALVNNFEGDQKNSEIIWSVLASTTNQSGEPRYYWGRNSYTFSWPNSTNEDFILTAAVDLNGDGYLDVITQHDLTGETEFYLNNEGNFTKVGPEFDPGIPLANLAKIHSVYDHESGLYNVIVQNGARFSFYRYENGVYVQQFNEDNPYRDLQAVAQNVTFGDVDRDGDVDAIFLNGQGRVQYYENLEIDGNKPPLVVDDSAKVISGTSKTINVLGNDWFWGENDLSALEFETVTAKGGEVKLDHNGTPDDLSDDKLIYTSPKDITEDTSDSFTYTLKDTGGNEVSGTVQITLELDEPPNAGDDSVDVFADIREVSVDVLRNDYEPNFQSMSIDDFDTTTNLGGLITLDDNGTADNSRDDKLIYTAPEGISEKTQDSFTYTVTDETGNSTVATVEVTIIPRLFVLQPENKNPFAGLDAGTSIDKTDYSTPVLVDFDGDGDLDLVSGNQDGEAVYFRNDNGTFNQQTGNNNPFENIKINGTTYSSFAIADFDGDGDHDIVGGDQNQNRQGYDYWRNDNGTYTRLTGSSNPVKNTSSPHYSLVTAVDWDGDGDQDFVASHQYRQLQLFLNQNGILRQVSEQDNPFQSFNNYEDLGQHLGQHISTAFYDFDLDGDLDLLTSNSHGYLFAFRNDGFDQWTQLTGSDHPFGEDMKVDVESNWLIEHTTLTLGDVNKDGKVDLVTGTRDGRFFYWENVTPSIATPKSDLTPSPPEGWHSAIIVSDVPGTNIDTEQIVQGNDIYIDLAFTNLGDIATVNDFAISLYLNNDLLFTQTLNRSLNPNLYASAEDVLLPSSFTATLQPGVYSLTLELDPNNQENEIDETNNIFEKTFTISAINQSPELLFNEQLFLDEGSTEIIINTLLQVTDINNTAAEIIYTITDLPDNGVLLLNNNPLAINSTFTQADIDSNYLTYTHNGSETVVDGFSFTVTDGQGGTIETTAFSIAINPVNDEPIAVDDSYSVNEDTILSVDANDGVLANDYDLDGDSLRVITVSNDVDNGILTLNSDGSFEYIPNFNFSGTDSFIYTVSDGNGTIDEGMVTINVSKIATLDIDGNGVFELQDSNLIDLYAAKLDQFEFDFLLNNSSNDLIGENATRTDAESILEYLNQEGDSLFDIDNNGVVEAQDFNLIDLYTAQLDVVELGFLIDNFPNDLIGENATRTNADAIMAYFETIAN